MNRYVFLLHRYLGIALGLVISIWCLSGIVMMYVQYPELSPAEEVSILEPLDLGACCVLPAGLPSSSEEIENLRIEMMAGTPVLRLEYANGLLQTINLVSGEDTGRLETRDAEAVAASFAASAAIDDYGRSALLARDQWTVYGAYNPHRPLYKFAGKDDARTQWYVSSATGEVVQVTTRRERFWNWLGAVPHWLYPTVLRRHTALWSQVVIWLTIVGTFLTVLGMYVGLRQFRSRRSGRLSPYRGAALWHHYAGLIFGVLMLTFLISGFFSMNPWGALESRSFAPEIRRQRGGQLMLDAALLGQIEQLPLQILPPDTVRLQAHVIAGERFFVAWNSAGERTRPAESPVGIAESARIAFHDAPQRMRPGSEVLEAGWMHDEDRYYYSHHENFPLPVYRVVYADGERLYLDALTGELTLAVDSNRRWYRWLHYGLHRGDFTAGLRARPLWDGFMLPLMAGVSLSALTGTWIGLRRIRRWHLRREKNTNAVNSLVRTS